MGDQDTKQYLNKESNNNDLTDSTSQDNDVEQADGSQNQSSQDEEINRNKTNEVLLLAPFDLISSLSSVLDAKGRI